MVHESEVDYKWYEVAKLKKNIILLMDEKESLEKRLEIANRLLREAEHYAKELTLRKKYEH